MWVIASPFMVQTLILYFSLLHHYAIIFLPEMLSNIDCRIFYLNFKLFTVIVLLIMLLEILKLPLPTFWYFYNFIIHSDCARLILLPEMPYDINSASPALCHNFMNIDELVGTPV